MELKLVEMENVPIRIASDSLASDKKCLKVKYTDARVCSSHGPAAGPYLYRYLSASVKGGPKAVALVRAALAEERVSIEQRTLWVLGLRWVAKGSI